MAAPLRNRKMAVAIAAGTFLVITVLRPPLLLALPALALVSCVLLRRIRA
jgi:hypothetical protein